MRIIIYRENTSNIGTFGRMYLEDEKTGNIMGAFYTCEPPWKNNQTSISCIPDGIYTVNGYRSAKFGDVLSLAVPNRLGIIIHRGNWGGDRSEGYKYDTDGCILPGLGCGEIDGQHAVTSSRLAMDKMLKLLYNQAGADDIEKVIVPYLQIRWALFLEDMPWGRIYPV
jgi:hypothetical protein